MCAAFPKLMKSASCTFDKFCLLLLPSVDNFEDQLLSTLTEDLMCDVRNFTFENIFEHNVCLLGHIHAGITY